MENQYVETTALRKILAMKRKYRFASGGTGAAKTTSILQVILDVEASLVGKRFDVVGETIPSVRAGAWEDCLNIIEAQRLTPYLQIATNPDLHIVFPNRSVIHFLAFDKVSKAHGARRWGLFLNEANHIPWPIADQLMVRTDGPIYGDWNPSAEFWAYDEIIYNPDFAGAWDFVNLTYKDNEGLRKAKIADIERRKNNPAWWRTYGLGLLGTDESRIFHWRVVPGVPFEATLLRRGQDFGFTNDPSATIALYEYNGGYILDEECYATGMMNPAIAGYLATLPHPETLVIADSSEPKSIAEIRVAGQKYGLSILGAQKWPGYKKDAVHFVRDLPVSVTARSTNLRKEAEQYLWLEDRLTGKSTNEPPDGFDHAIDAALYTFNPLITSNRRQEKQKTKAQPWSFAQAYGGTGT